MDILSRFFKYISIDTTSNESALDTPSTENQLKLAKVLVDELGYLNVDDIHFDQEHCYVYATLKGNKDLPKIGFIAHLDTSDGAPGNNINVKITPNYDGESIILDEDKILSPLTYPDLKNHIGKTLITTDGKTLLGADDKAGIAEIMSMLEYYSKSDVEHGDICVCFTPDEEIGLSPTHIDRAYFSPDFAYTVDGSSLGEFSYENFNAASADIEIEGISTHAGSAKGIMVNAVRIASLINSLLPEEVPENTEGYEGFYHLESIEGNVTHAKMHYIIRDFDKDNFENRKNILTKIVEELNNKFGNSIKLKIKDTYYNMYEVISDNSELISNTLDAIKNADVTPLVEPIRGGTDGTVISYKGIPCPNLGTGGHNFHSVYEYICVEDMDKTVEVLIEIVKQFSKTKLVTKDEKKKTRTF